MPETYRLITQVGSGARVDRTGILTRSQGDSYIQYLRNEGLPRTRRELPNRTGHLRRSMRLKRRNGRHVISVPYYARFNNVRGAVLSVAKRNRFRANRYADIQTEG